MRLNQNIDHVAVLIHGTPQILLLAVDSNEGFNQMPLIAKPSLASFQLPSIGRTELLTSLPDRLIGHDDSPLGEKMLHIPEAQAEAMIRPDGVTDDLARKSIAGVRRPISLHRISVSVFMLKLTKPVRK
jgi:hypothetical protein